MNNETPLQFARDGVPVSGLQPWAWALAIVLALLACAIVLWWRRQGGGSPWLKTGAAPVRKLGGVRLSQKVSLEVVEFDGRRILLSVGETGAHEIMRDSGRETAPETCGSVR